MAPSAAPPVTRWPSGPLLATQIGMSARTGLKDSLPLLKLPNDLYHFPNRRRWLLAHNSQLREARDAGAYAKDGALI
jgi:hypothetical protein